MGGGAPAVPKGSCLLKWYGVAFCVYVCGVVFDPEAISANHCASAYKDINYQFLDLC